MGDKSVFCKRECRVLRSFGKKGPTYAEIGLGLGNAGLGWAKNATGEREIVMDLSEIGVGLGVIRFGLASIGFALPGFRFGMAAVEMGLPEKPAPARGEGPIERPEMVSKTARPQKRHGS